MNLEYSFYLSNKDFKKTCDYSMDFDWCSIDYSTLHPTPYISDNSQRTLIVLGTVIGDESVYKNDLFNQMSNSQILESVKSYNGQFAIILYCKNDKRLSLITDVTASYPIFYRIDNQEITLSLSYSDIWKRDVKCTEINYSAFYELFYLRRVFGAKTYDKKTKFLSANSILTLDSNYSVEISKYREFEFNKSTKSFDEQAHELADLIKKSVLRRISDNKNYGLLLSGGLDSRVPLAVAKNVFKCFSAGYHKNSEYEVAKAVAALEGHEHFYIQRPHDNYDQLMPNGVYLTDSMREFHSANWALIVDQFKDNNVDTVLSGYAYDYLLGDNYLPRAKKKFLGKTLPIYEVLEPASNQDFAEFFLNTISWRYKSSNSKALVSSDKYFEKIKTEINEKVDTVKARATSYLDVYQFLTVDDLSRHSMYIESSLLRVGVEDRVPGIDKDIIEYSFQIPYEYKFNYKLYKKAIELIDPQYVHFINANTNYPASLSPYHYLGTLAYNKIKAKAGFKATLPPNDHNRSWGDPFEILKRNPGLLGRVQSMENSSLWDHLPDLNRTEILKQLKLQLEGKANNIPLVNLLVGAELFLGEK